jgi:integrase
MSIAASGRSARRVTRPGCRTCAVAAECGRVDRSLPKTDEVYVFSTEPGTHFSGFSKAMDRLRELSGSTDWTIHDLRRILRTGISGLKNAAGHRIGADIAERVLGHVIPGVRGIYDRCEYLDEKREALDLWAARLAEIVSPPPSNVIPLRPPGAAT